MDEPHPTRRRRERAVYACSSSIVDAITPSRQWGGTKPIFCHETCLSSTENGGRRAGRGNSSVRAGRTVVVAAKRPALDNVSRTVTATSNHEQTPASVK